MRMTDSGFEAAAGPTRPTGPTEDQVRAEAAVPAVPFGEWPSPITAAQVASGQVRLGSPTVLGTDVWWQEGLPGEGGRTTVMHSRGGEPAMLLGAPWNARTRVHEYGGRSYLPIPSAASGDGTTAAPSGYQLLFANYADQRLYLTAPGDAEPAPLTPDPAEVPGGADGSTLSGAGLRYADFVLSPDRTEVWCVQERHDGGKVRRAIVAVPLDGSAAGNAEAIRTLVDGF